MLLWRRRSMFWVAGIFLLTSCMKIDNTIQTNLPSPGSSAPEAEICPANFVRVPALSPYTTEDFCVAKYEMKIQGDDNGDQAYNSAWVAEARVTGTPWVNITRPEATTECQALGLQYDLIGTAEWQSIARNIEQTAWNWSNGSVGDSGGLSRSVGMAAGIAASDDSDPCNGTGSSCSLSTWNAARRVHRLSNGKYIWDLAGNVGEWTKTDIGTVTGDIVISQISNATAKSAFGPTGNYSALNAMPFGGLGEIFDNGIMPTAAIIRGGAWGPGTFDTYNAGIFSVNLNRGPMNTENAIGFRCVFRPTTPLTQSLYTPDTTPAVAAEPDAGDYEFGVTFTASVNGHINGVRFYRGAANGAGYTVNLWTSGGVNLASATGSDGTIPGWQEIQFASPVAITAGTTYVASYYTSVGNYPYTSEAFTTGWRGMPYLTAVAGGGVFRDSPGFPVNSFNNISYLVDISFTASP